MATLLLALHYKVTDLIGYVKWPVSPWFRANIAGWPKILLKLGADTLIMYKCTNTPHGRTCKFPDPAPRFAKISPPRTLMLFQPAVTSTKSPFFRHTIFARTHRKLDVTKVAPAQLRTTKRPPQHLSCFPNFCLLTWSLPAAAGLQPFPFRPPPPCSIINS